MKIHKKTILPLQFKANACACGIKKSGKPDLALIYSCVPAKAAALFTTNKIQAAPVILDKKYLRKSALKQAVIINSGNANCFTGLKGLKDSENTALNLAKELGINKESVLVSSTGIIGKKLPVEKIISAIPGLAAGLSFNGMGKVAKAIMTTDVFSKEITVRLNIAGTPIIISGVAKGAGMIAPNMATMLCFITTDANITKSALDKALKNSVEKTFNCITVDGCMSTNDSVIVLANGASGNKLIELNNHYGEFFGALHKVCLELAKMIVLDAEGSTKFIQIKVKNARDFEQARIAALAIANSNLFKCAMFGEDPNFGRVVASVGASGIDINEHSLKVKLGPLHKKEIYIEVSLSQGDSECTVYTSDLTPQYIKINADYN